MRGDAVTTAPVPELRLEVGVQLYVLAPPAMSVIPVPGQIVVTVVGLIVTVGSPSTVTSLVAVATQPLVPVPVTV